MLDNYHATKRSEAHNTGFNIASQAACDILDGMRPPTNTPVKKEDQQNQEQQTPKGLKRIVLAEKFHGMAGSMQNAFHSGQQSYFNPPKDLADSVKPYIGLRARLSQIWINNYTIFLILIIVKLVMFRASLSSSLETAEKYTMSSCKSAENMGSSVATMPHYLAIGANSLISKGLNSTRDGLIEMLMLSLTVLEQLLLFVINMLVGTYACLLTVAVNTAANTAINATEAVVHFVDNSLNTVIDGLEDGVQALEKAVNAVGSAFNSIASAFKDDDRNLISNVSISLGSLKNLSIPTSINSKLEELRKEVPDYSDVKNATSKVITIPFNMLKTEINDTMLRKAIPFNVSAIYIPPKQEVTFCSTNSGIEDFYNQLQDGISFLSKVFIILLAVLAVLICIPLVYREIKKWAWINQCAEDVKELYDVKGQQGLPGQTLNPTSTRRVDNIEMIQAASHKWVTRMQLFAAKRFSDLTQKTLAKWWVDYVLYPPALMVLILGLSGTVIVIIQFIIFSQVKASLPAFEKGMDATAEIVLSDVQYDISKWANSTNQEIANTQNDINDNLLGWIHTATGSINDTLGVFSSTMNNELKQIFGDTPLYDGISGVVYCVIGSKVEAIQKGIAWVHKNSQISLPNVTADYILPGALMDENPGIQINASSGNSSVARLTDSAVALMISSMRTLVEVYEKSLLLELKISIILLSIWLFVALCGFLYCYFTYRRVQQNVPYAKNFVHKRDDSTSTDWSIDEKDKNLADAPESARGLGACYQHYKDKMFSRVSEIKLPKPAKFKDRYMDNGSTVSLGNLSIDKEWRKYREGAQQTTTPVIPASAFIFTETPTQGINQPEPSPTYSEYPETPITPTKPVPVRKSPVNKPHVKRSPTRKSLHAVHGYMKT